MQFFKTAGWVIITVIVMIFLSLNWTEPQKVRIWPSFEGEHFTVYWPVGVIGLVFFLLGMIPTWLLHRGTKWRLNRRIKTLENAVKATATSPDTAPATTSVAASTDDSTPLSSTNSGETKTWP